MDVHGIVLDKLAVTVGESSPMPFPESVSDDMMLDEFWLDSVALANLFIRIEEALNCSQVSFTDGTEFPRTVGDVVRIYEKKALATA